MDNKLKGEFILNQTLPAEAEVPLPTPPKDLEKTKPIVHNNPHFYSSFCQFPKGVTFAEQEKDEKILLLLRRHFVTNVPWIATALFFVLLPISFPFIIQFTPFPIPSQTTLILYFAFYYLVLFGFVLVKFTLWYFHTGLVTTHRLIDIDLHGILYRNVAEAKNRNIEDVKYIQSGFILSLFNYGNVLVQTAGSENNIEYDRVPRPSQVANIIGDLH